MIALKLKDIADLVAGTLSSDCDPEAIVTGAVRIDSRIIEPGDLFVAMQVNPSTAITSLIRRDPLEQSLPLFPNQFPVRIFSSLTPSTRSVD